MKNYSVLFLLFCGFGFSQVKDEFYSIDSKMNKIPQDFTKTTTLIAQYISDNFKTDNEKIRAAFFWTANAISYDVDKLKLATANPKERTTETSDDKIKYALESKKGVCIHYAEVFKAITKKLSIETIIISGYTKQNGIVATLSHAWCTSFLEGKWVFFDPTWASGTVNQKNVFVKKLNNFYYKTEPKLLIKSHMPFDYLWQLLEYPISNQDFYDAKINSDLKKEKFDFNLEIANFEKRPNQNQLIESVIRIEASGLKNDLIKQEVADLKQKITFENFSKITTDYNQAITLFNDFISYRNNQFKPNISDDELLQMIQKPITIFKDCQERSNKLGVVNQENVENVRSLKKAIIEIIKQSEDHEVFVKEYLSKGNLKRKMMFKKITFFGVPIH